MDIQQPQDAGKGSRLELCLPTPHTLTDVSL